MRENHKEKRDHSGRGEKMSNLPDISYNE
ncbi:Hypothetical protein F387_00222 [Wohlfahrtiimonas chitiniclastica SH04]|uniref:Uncharacterized protein n=1 Tax=Wohlfahrtiimonas chitiniclastica SH04 TaxID=1261130 RepID=L8Y1J0_9GAMM|nr:Hypothetical protein F387_00222 [Wohlfahrtiimonas chitiniclastica SH04]